MTVDLLGQAGEGRVIEKILNAAKKAGATLIDDRSNRFIGRRADQAEYEVNEDHPDGNFQHAGSEHSRSPFISEGRCTFQTEVTCKSNWRELMTELTIC